MATSYYPNEPYRGQEESHSGRAPSHDGGMANMSQQLKDPRIVYNGLAIPPDADMKSRDIIGEYDDCSAESRQAYMRAWHWLWNYNEGESFRPPTGYVMAIEKQSPVIKKAFPEESMFGSTVMLNLNKFTTKQGKNAPSRQYLESRLDTLVHALSTSNGVLPEESSNPPSINYLNKLRLDKDKQDLPVWSPSLGRGDATAGLYCSMKRRDNFYVDSHWIAISSCNASLSKDLKNLMSEYSDSGKTMNDLMTSQEYKYLNAIALRNKKYLLWNIAKALDLESPSSLTENDTFRGDGSLYVKPHVSVKYNYIDFDNASNCYVFYNGCTDARDSDNKFVPLYEGPYLGYSLLHMQNKVSTRPLMGKAREEIEISKPTTPYGAFPINTGRTPISESIGVAPVRITPPASCPTRIVYEPVIDEFLSSPEDKLVSGFYRKRDGVFKGFEERIAGRKLTFPEDQLVPWIEKITSN